MSNDVHIRDLGIDDRDAYYALRLLGLETRPQAFATSAQEWRAAPPEKIDALLRLSEKNMEPILGAFTSSGELVGIVCLIPETKPSVKHKASLGVLFVHPSWQRKGIGTHLVHEALHRARQRPELMLVRLVVDSDNTAALRLFEKAGFFIYGREPQARRVQEHYHDQTYMLCFLRSSEPG